jgi:hypothetical protein
MTISITNERHSIIGETKYPWLTQADTQFNSDGVYHTKLIVKQDKAQEHIKVINNVISKEIAKQHQLTPDNTKPVNRAPLPYKVLEDGTVEFNIKMKASGINSKTKQPFTQSPRIVDKKLNEFPKDKNIFGGSICKIIYEPIGYNVASTGIGCTLRLKGVQVLKLVDNSLSTQGFTVINDNELESIV